MLKYVSKPSFIALLTFVSAQQAGVTDLVSRTSRQVDSQLLDAINASRQQITGQIRDSAKTLSNAEVPQRQLLLAEWQEKTDTSDVDKVFIKAYETDGRNRATQLVLDSLYFEHSSDRHEAIAEAHATTFSWIYEEQPTDEVSWTSFTDWLSKADHSGDPYWITGKAGSGKSTLMRFLVEDPRTRDYLGQWVKSCQLILASYFF